MTKMHRIRRCRDMNRYFGAALVVVIGAVAINERLAATPSATPPASKAPKGKSSTSALEGLALKGIIALLDDLERDGNIESAEKAAARLFEQVAVFASDRDVTAVRESAFAVRLVSQLKKVDKDLRQPLLAFLRANPNLAHKLAFLIGVEDDPKAAYALLDRLRQARGGVLERYASLAAAVCVVHDKPLSRRMNENVARSVDPLLIFDYFVESEKSMALGLCDVPAELLVYVVDTTSTIDELRWARQRYRGDANVGARFFEISYDYDHLVKGKPKGVTEHGFNLPNILKYGGICADQAYFACEVGKSIGVPTAYTVGRGGEMGHAWVGFLQAARGGVAWNFSSGRYEEYQGIKGEVMDPRTRRPIPDSSISLLAELSMTSQDARFNAAAWTDAARCLRRLAKAADTREAAPAPLEEGAAPARGTGAADQLALLELALRQCAGYARAWYGVRDLAAEGELTLADKKKWATVLHRLCADKYPDYYLEVLRPMIKTVESVDEQNRLWEAAFATFSARADLAAEVRLEQGQMWEEHGKKDRAGKCYEDVTVRYVNAGPFALAALVRAEGILAQTGRAELGPTLYRDTWARVDKPGDASRAFFRSSNWYRIGKAYVDRLQKAGQGREARAAQSVLDSEEQRRAATPGRKS